MNAVTFLGRNLRLYIRDRMGVFFSLLSALILIGLYALFLGQNQIDSLRSNFPHASAADVRGFVFAWVIAGVAMITTLTTSLTTVGAFVDDRQTGRFRDFAVTPVARTSLVIGYLLSGFIVSAIVTLVVLVGGEIVLVSQGVVWLTVPQALRLLGWTLLSCLAFSALASFLVTFIRTRNAFSALATILGTVIGFLAGAYVPVGVLPSLAQKVIAVLPFAQSAMLIRGPLTEHPLHEVTGGVGAAARALQHTYGITMKVGSANVSIGWTAAELAATAVVFTVLAVMRLSRGLR